MIHDDHALDANYWRSTRSRRRPAGRSICGNWAAEILGNTLPDLVRRSLLFSSLDAEALRQHVLSCEDQVRA